MKTHLRYGSHMRFRPDVFPMDILFATHGTTSSLHEHTFHEIVVVTKGEAQHVTEHYRHTIKRGDAFVILPGVKHAYDVEDELNITNIIYNPGRLNMPQADLARMPGYQAMFTLEPRMRERQRAMNSPLHSHLTLSTNQMIYVRELSESIRKELDNQDPGYKYLCIAKMMQLITYLSRAYMGMKSTNALHLTRLGEAISYIDQHLHEPIALAEVAELAHMSERNLQRVFKDCFDLSPVDYINQRKIENACDWLRNSDKSITQVAFQLGFSDGNYFTRLFRKVMDCTPTQYRKATQGPAANP